MRVNIAFGATEDWLQYTRITVASILANSNKEDKYHFYIMSNNFSEQIKSVFMLLNKIRPAEYHFIQINDDEFEGAIHDWLGVSSSYRLKLPSLTDLDKILYLDSDIIVLKDIAELYSYDIQNYYTAMVEDKCSMMMRRRVNLREDQLFFNGGVSLMNLKAFREHNLEEKIFKILRESTFYTDQDVINDLCRDKILSLPLKWNVAWRPIKLDYTPATTLQDFVIYKGRHEELLESQKDPALIHYLQKPWKRPPDPSCYWRQYLDLVLKLRYDE